MSNPSGGGQDRWGRLVPVVEGIATTDSGEPIKGVVGPDGTLVSVSTLGGEGVNIEAVSCEAVLSVDNGGVGIGISSASPSMSIGADADVVQGKAEITAISPSIGAEIDVPEVVAGLTPTSGEVVLSVAAPSLMAVRNIDITVVSPSMSMGIDVSVISGGANIESSENSISLSIGGRPTVTQSRLPRSVSHMSGDIGYWADKDNALTGDGSYASQTNPDGSSLLLYDYGFSIPEGVTIENVEIEVKTHISTQNENLTLICRGWDGEWFPANNSEVVIPYLTETPTVYTGNGGTDWTIERINSNVINEGIQVICTRGYNNLPSYPSGYTTYVDYAKLNVTYLLPEVVADITTQGEIEVLVEYIDDTPVAGAAVILDGELKYTDYTGTVVYLKGNGSFDLEITYPGGDTITDTIIRSDNDKMSLEYTMIISSTQKIILLQASDDAPIPNAYVYLNRADGTPEGKITNASGEAYFFRGVGIYRGRVGISNYSQSDFDVIVESPTVDYTLKLNPLYDLEFTIYNESSVAIEGVKVTIGSREIFTNALGKADFEDVSGAGNVNYKIEMNGYGPISGSTYLEADSTLSVYMTTWCGVRFFVGGLDGLPISGAEIVIGEYRGVSGDDGYCTIFVPESDYTYRVGGYPISTESVGSISLDTPGTTEDVNVSVLKYVNVYVNTYDNLNQRIEEPDIVWDGVVYEGNPASILTAQGSHVLSAYKVNYRGYDAERIVYQDIEIEIVLDYVGIYTDYTQYITDPFLTVTEEGNPVSTLAWAEAMSGVMNNVAETASVIEDSSDILKIDTSVLHKWLQMNGIPISADDTQNRQAFKRYYTLLKKRGSLFSVNFVLWSGGSIYNDTPDETQTVELEEAHKHIFKAGDIVVDEYMPVKCEDCSTAESRDVYYSLWEFNRLEDGTLLCPKFTYTDRTHSGAIINPYGEDIVCTACGSIGVFSSWWDSFREVLVCDVCGNEFNLTTLEKALFDRRIFDGYKYSPGVWWARTNIRGSLTNNPLLDRFLPAGVRFFGWFTYTPETPIGGIGFGNDGQALDLNLNHVMKSYVSSTGNVYAIVDQSVREFLYMVESVKERFEMFQRNWTIESWYNSNITLGTMINESNVTTVWGIDDVIVGDIKVHK